MALCCKSREINSQNYKCTHLKRDATYLTLTDLTTQIYEMYRTRNTNAASTEGLEQVVVKTV